MISDEPVDLSLDLHTSHLEKKPLLSVLSIKSLSRSEEGRGDQQTSPELLNKTFSMKSTRGNRQTHTHTQLSIITGLDYRTDI